MLFYIKFTFKLSVCSPIFTSMCVCVLNLKFVSNINKIGNGRHSLCSSNGNGHLRPFFSSSWCSVSEQERKQKKKKERENNGLI